MQLDSSREADCLAVVLAVLRDVGGVSQIEPDQDMYEAGLASFQALSVLAELETRFNTTLPDDQFVKARTARALCSLVLTTQNS